MSNRQRRLLLIVAIAAIVRFYGLAGQGFFMFDEARYLLESKRLFACISWSVHHISSLVTKSSAIPHALNAIFSGRASSPGVVTITDGGMARPLHVMLLSVTRSTPTVSLFLMALLGTASVYLLARIMARIAQERPGGETDESRLPEFAALLLAISPVHSFYSRTLLAEVDGAFFFLLALYFYFGCDERNRGDAETRRETSYKSICAPACLCVLTSRARLYIVGIAMGLALLVQSRMTMILPFVLGADLLMHRSLQRTLRIIGGLLAVVAVVELGYLAMKFLFLIDGRTDFFKTYFEQFIEVASYDQGRLKFNRPFFGLNYFLQAEGLPVYVLFFAGLFLAIREQARLKCNRSMLLLGGIVIWTIATASLFDPIRHSGVRWGRMVSPVVPLFAAIAAIPLDRLWQARTPRGQFRMMPRMAGLALCAMIVLGRVDVLKETMSMHSNYEPLLDEIAQRSPTKYFFSDEPLHVSYYLGSRGIETRFDPASETTTVVLFDENYAKNFGFYFLLPDTPSFVISNAYHQASRFQDLETMGAINDLCAAVPPVASPVKVYVLPKGYESRVHVRQLF